MFFIRLLILAFALICFHTVAAAPRYSLALRQDEKPSPTTSVPTESASFTSRHQQSTEMPSKSDHPSTSEEPTTHSTVIVTSSTPSASPTAIDSNTATNGKSPGGVTADSLPLHPKITPALELVGALFMISGALYAVVGIKNKWIYVFGSAAYLTALAVTVLIVYLMNPPVSNAVQGAFFVAAFITGSLFGALALIFSDLTEGLGCLLGGYCLSMWFLALKEDGLITSPTGRAIFIGILSFAGFCLSFSRYTRTYGLIGSISFSGATIAMLGVDCFSRAGLKEFWLYLWDLNPDTFPLNTNTYPVTKGMKAELAGVVILCLFGVISQLRVWKLIKERRAKQEEDRQQIAQSQQKDEEERGRQVEDTFQKERSQWEATYGAKAPHDSGHSTPDSSSVDEKDLPETPMSMNKPEIISSTLKEAIVTVVPIQDDEIQAIDANGQSIMEKDHISGHPATLSVDVSARTSSEAAVSPEISRSISVASSLKPSSRPPPPVIVPLPFTIPTGSVDENDIEDEECEQSEASAKRDISENASVSAKPDQPNEPSLNRQSLSQTAPIRRFSDKPAMKRLSTQRNFSGVRPVDSPGLMYGFEDDRRSSVAATLDEEDDMSLRRLSPLNNPVEGYFDLKQPTNRETDAASINTELSLEESTKDLSSHKPAVQHEPLSSSSSQDSPDQSLINGSDLKTQDVHPCVKEESQESQSTNAADADAAIKTSDNKAVLQGDLSIILPPRLSRVAQSYRTNEWAKHLETADIPEIDEIPDLSPGVQVNFELPAPVHEEIVQPFTVHKRTSRRISSDSTAHRNHAFMQINSNSTRESRADLPSLGRKVAQNPDVASSPVDGAGKRTSSAPTQPARMTLLGKRESLVRNRVSSQNFNQQPIYTPDLAATNEADMTLAERKRALKQHAKPPSASTKWQQNGWAAAVVDGFDSHQPKRTTGSGSDQKREVLLAGWRESIQGGGAPVVKTIGKEQQWTAMMQAKRQHEMEQQQQTMMTQHRESMRHSMMRSSEMLDAHREAMRRMQASANKRA